MKKLIIKLIIIIFICLVAYFTYTSNFKETTYDDLANKEYNSEEITIQEPEKNSYTDSNPMSVGFYLKESNGFGLVEEFSAPWYVGPPDICVLSVLPKNDKTINESVFKTAFDKLLDEYENTDTYKIGYHIKFSMKDGFIVDNNILTVEDTQEFFDKIMVFLYDDVNMKPGQKKYHVTKETFNEETLFTSIKLTGGVSAEDVESPIELSVFTYKDMSDFDPDTGKYRGNSIYTINVFRK